MKYNLYQNTYIHNSLREFRSATNMCLVLLNLGLLLLTDIPVVEMSCSDAQIRREAQPGKVRCLTPSCNLVHRAPQVSQITIGTNEGKNIDSGGSGAFGNEEERHPHEVNTKLDSIQSETLFRDSDCFRRRKWAEADVGNSISCIAHDSRLQK